MQVVFSHAERKGGKDFRYLQIDKDGYTIPVITVLVLWGRDEGWRDISAFNFRKEHIKDYLEFLPVYSIPTISILDLNEEEKEKGREDGKQEGISIG